MKRTSHSTSKAPTQGLLGELKVALKYSCSQEGKLRGQRTRRHPTHIYVPMPDAETDTSPVLPEIWTPLPTPEGTTGNERTQEVCDTNIKQSRAPRKRGIPNQKRTNTRSQRTERAAERRRKPRRYVTTTPSPKTTCHQTTGPRRQQNTWWKALRTSATSADAGRSKSSARPT